jgi:hypothetical protein
LTTYPGTAYRYFSIDSDHDLSADTLLIGTVKTSLTVTAAHVPAPSAHLLAVLPAVATGMTRYWWGYLCGLGTLIPLVCGSNRVYGQLADTPESLPSVWKFNLPVI